MGMGQNPIPLVNIKIAGKWMFIPLKMILIGFDPSPNASEAHGKSQTDRFRLAKKTGTPPPNEA